MSSPRPPAVLAIATALCSMLTACSGDELTELIVVVDSDLAVPAALDEITISAEGTSGRTRMASGSLSAPAALPVTVGLRPSTEGGLPVTIRVEGLLRGMRTVSAEVRTSFVDGRRLIVYVDLLARCIGSMCGDGYTCTPSGGCASAIVDSATLPRFTGVLPSEDMGSIDAGSADLGATDLGRSDLGPSDLGTPDLGPRDLGPSDLGPPDLGPPDLGPPDLGPGSCSAVYGMTPGFLLCAERPTECEFFAALGAISCGDVCNSFGGSCRGSYDDLVMGACTRGSPHACGSRRDGEICVCTR